jgi:ADP-heptose:LPS heptosyltransferase
MTGVEPSSVNASHVDALRQRAYDVVLCTESVRHHTALWLALRLGAPNRVAFGHKGLTGLITTPIRLPHPMPWAAQFREMVTGITGVRPDDPLRPHVYLSEADRRAAWAEWNRLGYTATSRVLACSLTTKQQVGHVPPAFFVDVLRAVLAQDPDIRIVLCGTLDDGRILRPVADALGARASLSVGALSLLPYAAFLARCGAFFGRDSGPRHLANAVETPVFFVRNLGTSAVETGKYCSTEHDVAPDGEYLNSQVIAERLNNLDKVTIAGQIVSSVNARAQRRD